jgi:ribosomal protein L29
LAAATRPGFLAMDKKAKKRIDLLNSRLQKLRMQLAGAKKQMDEPGDISRLEKEIADVHAEVEKLKGS